MLPNERLRNRYQRLIPLTPELIQDMLNHKGLEYQTSSGGHVQQPDDYSPEYTSLTNLEQQKMDHNLQYTSSSQEVRKHHRKERYPSIDAEGPHKKRHPHKHSSSKSRNNYQLELLYTGNVENSSSNIMSTVEPEVKSQRTKVPKTVSVAALRREIKYSTRSSSDRLLPKPSLQLEALRATGVDNYNLMIQQWTNLVAFAKSETSFLLNRYKLQNYKANSSNAYYKPNARDYRRDHAAAASLMAKPIYKRYPRNAYW